MGLFNFFRWNTHRPVVAVSAFDQRIGTTSAAKGVRTPSPAKPVNNMENIDPLPEGSKQALKTLLASNSPVIFTESDASGRLPPPTSKRKAVKKVMTKATTKIGDGMATATTTVPASSTPTKASPFSGSISKTAPTKATADPLSRMATPTKFPPPSSVIRTPTGSVANEVSNTPSPTESRKNAVGTIRPVTRANAPVGYRIRCRVAPDYTDQIASDDEMGPLGDDFAILDDDEESDEEIDEIDETKLPKRVLKPKTRAVKKIKLSL